MISCILGAHLVNNKGVKLKSFHFYSHLQRASSKEQDEDKTLRLSIMGHLEGVNASKRLKRISLSNDPSRGGSVVVPQPPAVISMRIQHLERLPNLGHLIGGRGESYFSDSTYSLNESARAEY